MYKIWTLIKFVYAFRQPVICISDAQAFYFNACRVIFHNQSINHKEINNNK